MKEQQVSRRKFFRLAGMATLGGATMAAAGGCSAGKSEESGTLISPVSFSRETDVLIIGSGASAMWASYELLKAGIKPLIVEKEPVFGGDSMLTCTILPVMGTKPMRDAGMGEMTPDQVWEKFGKYFAKWREPELAKSLIVNGAKVIDTWTEEFGVKWMPFEPGATAHFHVPAPGLCSDVELFNPLYEHITSNGTEVMFDTKATSFILDENDEIVGVRTQNTFTLDYTDIKANTVMVATGDWVSNQEMVVKYLPDWARMQCTTYTSMGQGMQMAMEVGAATERMDDPCNFTGDNANIVCWGFWDPVLQITPAGTRFINEQLGHEVAPTLAHLGYTHFYCIMDEAIRNGGRKHSMDNAEKLGLMEKADTIEELAAKILVPADVLAETLKNFNAAMEAGEDAEFGRTHNLRPLQAPFYSFLCHPVRYKTYGGLQVNANQEVLNSDGEPIPHLYAAGSVTGSMTPNLMDACASGINAGEKIAAVTNAE